MQNNVLFSQLDKQLQIKRCTIPQRVFSTKDPDEETYEQKIIRQDNFLKLSAPIREKLSSSETSEKIQQIGKAYNLELFQLADISRAVRGYYFGEIKLEDFSHVLFKEMGIDLDTAREISKIVIEKIIMDNSAEKAYQSRIENISIIDALKKYPNLAEQSITSNPLKIREYQEPVRPSIKNWLSDYTANVGYKSHNSVERGNYLFQSENTRNLGFEDRQRLSQFLKSFDEKTPLTVDLSTKQIVFSEYAPNRKPEASSISNDLFKNDQITPASKINYNFPAKLQEFDFPSSYQPKTKEPGSDFEKVIQLEEKEEPPSLNIPRIVNLKDPAMEKPPVPAFPQPKNLLNIKDLVEQSQKEREESAIDLHKFAVPASAEKSYFKNTAELSSKPEIKEADRENNIHSENNFVGHNNTFHESLDETEKNLFQKNNDWGNQNIQFTHSPKFSEKSKDNLPGYNKLESKGQLPEDSAKGFSSYEKLPNGAQQDESAKEPEVQVKPEVPAKPPAQPYRIHPSEF